MDSKGQGQKAHLHFYNKVLAENAVCTFDREKNEYLYN